MSILSVSLTTSGAHPSTENPYLNDLLERIKSVIDSTISKQEVLERYAKTLECPVTCATLEEPIVLSQCGHVFSRSIISKVSHCCPMCRDQFSDQEIHSMAVLKDLIFQMKKDSVVHFSQSFSQDLESASQLHTLAQRFKERGCYSDALKTYEQTFQYLRGADYYKVIPEIYQEMGAFDKANLSKLYLSLYQLQEGKIVEALDTLQNIQSDEIDVQSLIIQVSLLNAPSKETVQKAVEWAKSVKNLQERLVIYNQILAIDPCQFEVHKELISMMQDTERKKLLECAIALAKGVGDTEWEAIFLAQAERPPLPTVLTQEMWKNPQALDFPDYYPLKVRFFLQEPCLFSHPKPDGTRPIRAETHTAFPIFSWVKLNDGKEYPLNLETLNWLEKEAGGQGFSSISSHFSQEIKMSSEPGWVVMYTGEDGIIPKSKGLLFDQQKELLARYSGYEVPTLLEGYLAILLEYRKTGKHIASQGMLCQEVGKSLPVIQWYENNLSIYPSDLERSGLGAMRKFRRL